MNESIRLGRIAGVAVGVNWTLIVIFVLIASGLAFGRFPEAFPDEATWAYAVAGLVTACLFFASVLLHEVSHAVVARRNGVEVDGIVLWLFGGVARLTGEADEPGAELRIAGVGPLVSFLLGGTLLGLAAALGQLGVRGLVVEAAVWLGAINVVLAVFNLFPGAPLDGGRVLRSILWWRTGDKHQSWVRAARAGRVVGFTVIALGILQFAAGGVGGLWLVLIGWFLVGAAGAEEAHAEVKRSLGDLPVSEVMTRDPVVAPANLSINDFLEDYVFRHRFSTFPVDDAQGRVVGLATVNRIKDVERSDRTSTAVGDVATPIEDVVTVAPQDRMVEVLDRMSTGADGRMLVVEDDDVVGIVSPTDIMRLLELRGLRDDRDHAEAP